MYWIWTRLVLVSILCRGHLRQWGGIAAGSAPWAQAGDAGNFHWRGSHLPCPAVWKAHEAGITTLAERLKPLLTAVSPPQGGRAFPGT